MRLCPGRSWLMVYPGLPMLSARLIMFMTLAILFLPGCGNSGPELGQVEGVVTLDGAPLPEAIVFFKHQNGGRIARAVTDEAGHYELNFSLSNAGAIVGSNTVRISTYVEALRDDAGHLIPETGKQELVPKEYNRETDLMVDVEPGANVFNFDLTSSGMAAPRED